MLTGTLLGAAQAATLGGELFTVLCWAALTGATAGALLGAVLGRFAPSLRRRPVG